MSKVCGSCCGVYYEIQGQGEPIVLQRGLSRSSRYWCGFDHLLAKHYQVISIDARGLGQTTREAAWSDSIYDLADDTIAVLDHLNIPHAHFFGVSLGGMIGLALALKSPDRLSSLSVVNTSVGGFLTMRMSPAVVSILPAVFWRRRNFSRRLAVLLLSKEMPGEKVEALIREWDRIGEIEGLPVIVTLKQLCAAIRFFAAHQLPKINVPTLILYGSHDRFVPNVNSTRVHRRIPKAKLVEIAGAGHEPTSDCPEKVIAALREFIEPLSGSNLRRRA